MSVTIRKATTDAEREAIYRLRYRVSIEELDRHSSDADAEQRWIRDAADDYACLFLAEDDGDLVGTVRFSFGGRGRLPNEEWFQKERFTEFWPEAVSTTDRLVVLPEYRGSTVSGRLAMACYVEAREVGVIFDFVVTRPHLVSLYQQMGYRFSSSAKNHPHYGCIFVMTLAVEDNDHLKNVRSPFQRLARRYPASHVGRDHLTRHFSHFNILLPSHCADAEALWEAFGSALFRHGTNRRTLLTGFNRDEAISVLQRLTPLTFEADEVIVAQGEIGQGLFCMIAGTAEVYCKIGERIEPLGELNPGDSFGELGFIGESKRSATVRATSRCQVVIATASEFVKLRKTCPELACKMMTNLFATMSERYVMLQERLIEFR